MVNDQKSRRAPGDQSPGGYRGRLRHWSPAYLAIVLLAIPLLCLLWALAGGWLLRGIK
jgi:hypothetical protein